MTGIRNMLLLATILWMLLYLAFHLNLFLAIAASTFITAVLATIVEFLEKRK